jgi:hypothetical protein
MPAAAISGSFLRGFPMSGGPARNPPAEEDPAMQTTNKATDKDLTAPRAPEAHELTAFELALVTGGSGCPSTAFVRVATPKPPVTTKV